jgi:digeranylgeranylglycerophospholipid reductase
LVSDVLILSSLYFKFLTLSNTKLDKNASLTNEQLDAIKNKKTDADALYPYEENWRNAIESKINSAGKVQDRWIGLSDKEWDKELDIIKELKTEEFLDFIKADFGLSNMLKLAVSHPKLAVRQLFNLVKGK